MKRNSNTECNTPNNSNPNTSTSGRLDRSPEKEKPEYPVQLRTVDGENSPRDFRTRLQEFDSEVRRIAHGCTLEHVAIGSLRSNPRNARKHPEHQIALLESVISQFGFIGAIVVDEANRIISGHGRVEAAKRLGMQELPCFRVMHLSDDQKTALALADNRLAELSSWDEDELAASLEELSGSDLDFDVEITGFDSIELDRILGEEPAPVSDKTPVNDYSDDPDDAVADSASSQEPISLPGDLWRCGDNAVIQGDACDCATYDALLEGELVAQVATDPPYNVPNAGHVSSKAFREFAMAHGEMSSPQFAEFLARVLTYCVAAARDGAIFHVCMDWRHSGELSTAAAHIGLETKNVCVWAKPSPGQGSFYRSQHEFVFVFKHGKAKHINNFGLGARGRTRSNVWRYPAVRGVRTGVNDPDHGHPTVKPVAMIADAIRDCSKRGDIILDPFGGSGTTLIAAERTRRRARLIEIDGHYVDLTLKRWQAVTGIPAIRARDGARFDELLADRDLRNIREVE